MSERDQRGARGENEGRYGRGGRSGGMRESSRCHTPGCIKYHDFFQWNGKYYCLECYETLRQHAATMSGSVLSSGE